MRLSRLLRVLLLVVAVFARPVFAAPLSDDELASLQVKARRGNAIAQYNLGLAYSEGRGVAADPLEAYVWLSLAMENGTRGRALDNLLGTLSNEQLTEARQRLAERRVEFGLKEPAATPAPAAPAPATPVRVSPAIPTGPGNPMVTPAPVLPRANVPLPHPETPEPSTNNSSLQADKRHLSTELSNAWAEIERLKGLLAQTQASGADAERYRTERDALSAKITSLAGDIATQRAESDQLHRLIAQTEKDAETSRLGSHDSEEKARAAEAKIGELVGETERLKAELGRQTGSLQTRVVELEQKLQEAAARPAAPVGPDLSGRVHELEAQLAGVQQKLTESDTASSTQTARAAQLAADLARANTDLEST
ncbi:MAG: hypothetical protein ACHQ5A_12780, partial [Opitutales bacterium]